MDEGTDNSEHVPRIGRIAESVRRALEQEGCDAVEADLVERELIDLGRALFVEEWMRPLDGDDQAPAEAEALAEFERCLREGQGQAAPGRLDRTAPPSRAVELATPTNLSSGRLS